MKCPKCNKKMNIHHPPYHEGECNPIFEVGDVFPKEIRFSTERRYNCTCSGIEVIETITMDYVKDGK